MYSLFILVILTRVIPLVHSISHALVLVQFPNPSLSICSTIFSTRSAASTRPCGSFENWVTFADTNSMALAFLQAATQAPHPIQAAALNDSSASCLFIGIVLASTVLPDVLTEI